MSRIICNNCGEHWTNCECWDIEDEDNNSHQILALRLQNGLTKSKFLQEKEKKEVKK